MVAMTYPRITGLLCAAVVCSATLAALAQEDDAPPPRMGPPHEGGPRFGGKRGKSGPPGRMADLSPDEAQRLKAARDKAADDPSIRALKASREAIDQQIETSMDSAILAADPSLAPVLAKIKEARGRAKQMREKFQSLTPDQKQALKSAREAAKDDPAVVAARAKMKSAQNPEQHREARRAMHEAMKAAMTKQNPELAPLLEKLGPPPGPDGPPMEGGPHDD